MLFTAVLVSSLSLAAAFPESSLRGPNELLEARVAAPGYKAYTIDMAIDHFPHSSRYEPHTSSTFKQRNFFDSSYYKPGGPVFLYISGETSGESRFSNLQTGIIQILMQAFNGVGVILENRYYGHSYPFNTSTTDQLAYLTTEQTIADNAYFAQHATFPGVPGDLRAPKTPWILYGGSLAGAQTAFSIQAHGDVLFGGIASSAVIHAVHAYPEWYNPYAKWGPSDCVSRIYNIIDKMDYLVEHKNSQAIQQLKAIFGLADLKDIRDFAMTIAFPLGGPMNYPTNTWQELNWNPGYNTNEIFEFCGNVTNLYSTANDTAVDWALAKFTNGEPWVGLGNYAKYVKNVIVSACSSGDINNSECFGTQNRTYWADTANSALRSYLYSTCTELGAYQVAQPKGPSLISRVLQIDYTQQWCTWAFPHGKFNKIPSHPETSRINKYGDLNFKTDRLAFIDGNEDVWNDLCYHSTFYKGPIRVSSDLHPEYLIAGGGHHWDSYGIKNVLAEPQFIREAHLWEMRTVEKWLRMRK